MPRVLVPLASGFEELEAVTIVDLLRRADIEVVTATLTDDPARPIEASRGTRHLADCALGQVIDDAYDMVVLPGGLPGADHLRDDPRVIDLLQRVARAGGYTAAICAAPQVLARGGLLDGRVATAYPGVLEGLSLGGTRLSADPVVCDGKVVTSRGPGTAMDFSLQLIELLAGVEVRDRVEAGLQRH